MSNDVIAENLKRLRAASGLSQRCVAERAGVAPGTYAAIERGRSGPRVQTLQAVARALGVPLRELLQPTVPLGQVRFRSHKKLRTRSSILANVGRWLRDYNELEELLDDRREFLLRMDALPGASGVDRPTAAARHVRVRLGLTDSEPVRDICGLLDHAGVKVFPVVVESKAFFGLSVGAADGGPAVVVNTWERISVERWIFTAAHELGHLLLHLDDYGSDAVEEDEAHEHEANAFAAELLMPDEVFQREWHEARGLHFVDRVIKVKRIFRVSYRTVLHRLAPHYSRPEMPIWQRFATEYKRLTGRTLAGHVEPSALDASAFQSAAPAVTPGDEPDRLSPGDFREDRLAALVRRAIEEDEISLSRGAEVLGLSIEAMRARCASWID